MTLQRLSFLVLAVVLGTALTVRWYLDAEEAVQAARTEGSGNIALQQAHQPVHPHLPLPMRAEPARFRWVRSGAQQGTGSPCGASSSISSPSSSVPSLAPLVRRPGSESGAPTIAGPSAFEPGGSGTF